MEKVVVRYKSEKENFDKEKSGVKSNTIRKIDATDERTLKLRSGKVTHIELECVLDGEVIERAVTDYTEWDGIGIISWSSSSLQNSLKTVSIYSYSSSLKTSPEAQLIIPIPSHSV